MSNQDTRIWYNYKTKEVVECRYHYDCDVISEKIRSEGMDEMSKEKDKNQE